MIDYFEVLGVGRRPWLDAESLRRRFLEQSAQVHPDRVHEAAQDRRQEAQDHYTALNAAYQTLRDPKGRLLHLLTLERGQPPPEVVSIPHETTGFFTEVGALCRETDRFLAQAQAETSPLLKVAQFERSQQWIDRIEELQRRLQGWRDSLHGEIQAISGGDSSKSAPGESPWPLARLETIYRLLSYADRWTAQLQERAVQLML